MENKYPFNCIVELPELVPGLPDQAGRQVQEEELGLALVRGRGPARPGGRRRRGRLRLPRPRCHQVGDKGLVDVVVELK